MQKQSLRRDEAAVLIIITAILFGAIFRLLPAWMAGFPINDGGMFYTMIQDLLNNHYIPPLFTTYNNANIPFVYPPLGFYLGAFLTDVLGLSTPLVILQWLPAIINIFCIPAFYFLANEILGDKLQGALAALIFALTPHMTAWFSMGGGLTRAPGAFFMLLALANIHQTFTRENPKAIWGAIVFGGLTVLSHTEAPVYTIAFAFYFWLAKSRSFKGLLRAGLIAVGVIIIAAPWYGWIIFKHGFQPLLSAAQSGFHSTFGVLRIININSLTEEPYLGLLGVLGILGLAFLISGKKYFIPGLLFVVFLANPRSAHTIGNIPLAMAAGYFIVTVILPAITEIKFRRNAVLFFVVIIPFLLGNSTYYGFQLAEKHISPGEQEAMQWIANNTPEDSRFLVISGEQSIFCDAVSEWFPAFSHRQSLGTLQGSEWTKGEMFDKFLGNTVSLQACLNQGVNCILEEAENLAQDFSHLYVSRHPPTNNCSVTDASGLTRGLILELEGSAMFEAIFTSESTAIFIKK